MCYGSPLVKQIPEDDWVCERCLWDAEDAECSLCPMRKGAMKRTTDWKWAHLSCALWIPECFFRFGEAREPIDYLQLLPLRERWNIPCMHCKSSKGVALKCSHPQCQDAFHVTCGMENDVYLEYKTNPSGVDVIVSYCQKHAKRWHARRNAKSFIIVSKKKSKTND